MKGRGKQKLTTLSNCLLFFINDAIDCLRLFQAIYLQLSNRLIKQIQVACSKHSQSILIFVNQLQKLRYISLMNNQQQEKQKESHQPRIEYRKTNAYSQRWSIQQILTVTLFLIEVILHNTFITQAIAKQESSILWIMFASTYVLLVIIIIDYVILTCGDPVDDALLGIGKEYSRAEKKYCKYGCRALVHRSSYHCHTCNRCVVKFDHHCKYLNNCIGGKNYHNFFRLLVMVTAYCLFIIGSAIWIYVCARDDEAYNEKILSKWGVIATLIYTIIMLISVDSLLFFHCYLVLILKITTLQFLNLKPDDNVDTSKEVIQS